LNILIFIPIINRYINLINPLAKFIRKSSYSFPKSINGKIEIINKYSINIFFK